MRSDLMFFESVLSELTAYHGTNRAFQAFGKADVRNGKEYGPGHYFTSDPANASNYAGDDEGANVHMVNLSGLKFWDVSAVQDWADVCDELGILDQAVPGGGLNNYQELKSRMRASGWGPQRGDMGAEIGSVLGEFGYDGLRVPEALTGSQRGDWYVVFQGAKVQPRFASGGEK